MGLRSRLREIVRIKDSPHRLAFSFAVGVFIGMSPLLGLHTVLGIALSYIFNFNKLVTIVGVYVTNPWTIVPIYTFSTWIGLKLLGAHEFLPPLDWHNLSFTMLLTELKFLLWPFVIGTIVVGIVSAVISYVIIYRTVLHTRGNQVS